MIRVHFVEPDHDQWRDWKRRALEEQRRHNEAYERGERPKVGPLYKERKADFVAAFHGKCAYCEAPINETQPGDIDHFRPKNAVKRKDGKPVKVPDGSGGWKDHPGYYWLAYNPANLVFACAICNRKHKREYFPVEDNDYATCPDETDRPLLFNPVDADDPAPCFEFVPETGGLVGLTPKAQASIEHFGLNREALMNARLRSYRSALATIGAIWSGHEKQSPDLELHRRDLQAVQRGDAPFTFVFFFALREKQERLKNLVKDLMLA